jgi:hypothetical protein
MTALPRAAEVAATPIDELRFHPRMPEARRHYLDLFVALYDDDPFLSRLLIESGRIVLFNVLVMLDHAYEPEKRETWPTISRIKEELGRFGLASDRHVDELLKRLEGVGFVTIRPAPHDRRLRLIRPTARMISHDLDWLIATLAPSLLLRPDKDFSRLTQKDRSFHAQFRRCNLDYLPYVAELFAKLGPMLLFMQFAGGSLVVSALLQAAMNIPEGEAVSFSYVDIGDRFGVSRTQVRKILATAQEAGLVRLHDRGGRRVEVLPTLWLAFDNGIATGAHLVEMVYGRTEEVLGLKG